ncbi:unnamed protein product [Chilo suppressalis]|uniref:FP protein C-terminal domain-containing protein n=1 Tax=Chilo suppressalis TaxID=168631 RepID=A0ABN8BFZ7_CHISP|nr:unnamed protein product [Chilo suppressalis]
MPRVQRSPPSMSNINLAETQSEPDLSKSVLENKAVDDSVNLPPRNKRPRTEVSPVKSDILDMIYTRDANLMKLIENQNCVLNKLVADVAEIKSQNAQIQKTNQDIENSISFINQQYEDMKLRIEILEKERTELRNYTETLENKLRDLQLNARNASIEIRNVPATDKETFTDLVSIVTKIGMTIDRNVSLSDIRDVRRLPAKPGANKPIIVEFVCVQTKHQFLACSKSFNKKKTNEVKLNTSHIGVPGEQRPVFVDEYLPPTMKKLFYYSREFAKQHKYMFCWSSNGNIFLRKELTTKQILIKTEQCLANLLKQSQ